MITRNLGVVLVITAALLGCTGVPEGLKPVSGFDAEKYLGTWYEIARLDHSFERGLDRVTAEYRLRDDGGVNVINKGWDSAQKQWQQANGKAYFVRGEDEAYLKVSFFGPFYGSYVIFEMDIDNYQYAFVSGPNKNYLWLLSRTTNISDKLRNHFISTAKKHGFNTNQLIFVTH